MKNLLESNDLRRFFYFREVKKLKLMKFINSSYLILLGCLFGCSPAPQNISNSWSMEKAIEERDFRFDLLSSTNEDIRFDTISYVEIMQYILPTFKGKSIEAILDFIKLDYKYSFAPAEDCSFSDKSILIMYHPHAILELEVSAEDRPSMFLYPPKKLFDAFANKKMVDFKIHTWYFEEEGFHD